MKRKLFSIVMIVALVTSLVAAALPALAQGEENMGADPADRGPIGFGETIPDSIDPTGDVDTYTFSADAGDVVLIRMSQASGSLDPEIRFYGPGGTELASDWASATAEISSTLPDAGTYTVLACDHSGTYTGNYGIFVQRVNNPGNDTPIGFGETLSGSIDGAAEMDTYTFPAAAGDVVLIRMSQASGSLDPEVRLYGPGGTELASAWASATAEISSTLPDAGTYTVLACDHSGTYTGNYGIFVQRVGGMLPYWTFMVYLDADNNLDPFGIDDLNEMEVAGSTADVNIVVLLDLLGQPNSDIYYVMQGTSSVVLPLGEVNMGDPTTLVDFVLWTMTNYPAEHYALVLWDHGSGWKLENSSLPPKGVCLDETSGFDYMTSPELDYALSTIYGQTGVVLDIVGFDACLMGMTEIFYLIAPHAYFGVASEEVEPVGGWPYDLFLDDLVADPTMMPDTLANLIVTEYMNSYPGIGEVTLSAVRLSDVRSPALAADVSALASSMIASGEFANIILARAQTEYSYWDPSYIDLYHFAQNVWSYVIDPTVQANATAVMDAIDVAVIAEGHGALHPNVHGMSIYFPETGGGYWPNYETDLDFTADTQWDEFLHWFYECSPHIELTVVNREGEPAWDATVFVYADLSEPPVYQGRTDDSGYVALYVAEGIYTFAIASWHDHFYLVKPNVTSPSTLTLFAADETVPVDVVATKVDGTPLAGASIYPTVSKAWPRGIGNTDGLGEATVYMTPFTYRDIFLWDWSDLYYLYYSGVAIPNGGMTLVFDAAVMPTGEIVADLVNFSEAGLIPFLHEPDETWTAPVFSVSDESHTVLSEGSYDVWWELRKTDGEGRLWRFEFPYQQVGITPDGSVTMHAGGDFIASVEPEEIAYDPGEIVTLDCLIADSFDNRITWSSTYTPEYSWDNDNVEIYRNEDQDYSSAMRAFFESRGWQNNHPALTITKPDDSVFIQESSWQLFWDYTFHLPPDAMYGEWVITLSFDTGPHMGVIEGTSSFAVPRIDMPDLVIDTKWEEWVEEETTYTVHYWVHNQGNEIAPAGHDVTLIVDGVEIEHKEVPVPLAPGESYSDSFVTVIELTGGVLTGDEITVCADNFDEVDELNEENNCRTNIWPPMAAAIHAGKAWLAAQQNPDGSWGGVNQAATTGLAVLKFETQALELGLSPFDPTYQYHEQVESGLNYLFANADTIGIGAQPAGDPDTDGDGFGVYFSGPQIYNAGIAAMAIAASQAPGRVVSVPGSPVDGWTYSQVLQDTVDYLAWAQTDYGYCRGGWNYEPMDNAGDRSDQSNSGYATLGLAYAEAEPPLGFGLSVPDFVRMELNIWIDYIQNDVDGDDDDGGSGYDFPDGVNILRTGNLLQQMAWFGDSAASPRVQDAIDYLVRHWNDPNDDPGWNGTPSSYQAMYTTMKGLESFEPPIGLIGGIDWFDDFVVALVAEQNPDGSWPQCIWDDGELILSTEWALLTLEKVVVEIPPEPDLVIENKHEEWVEEGMTYTIHYWVHNQGAAVAPAGHDATLYVDGVVIEEKEVPVPLAPGESYSDSFVTVITLSGGTDEITVCADNFNEVDERIEENNCLTNIWPITEVLVEVEDAAVIIGGSTSVDIWVRNFPDDGFGLGCYTIRIDYDPTMVQVTDVSAGDVPFNTPIFNIYADYVSITQFSTAWPGPTGDIMIADLEFHCLGAGISTLDITIETLANTGGEEIAAAPVNGTITQLYLEAETSIADEQDFDDVVVVPATIVRVKDPVTHETVFGIPIGCYEARALYNPAGIEMLTVRPGDPPFDTPVFDINNPEGWTAFTQFTVAGSEPPIIVARLVPRLIGCALDSYNLEVTFDLIADPDGGELPQQEPQFLTFQRGDISGDGEVNIIDAMFGAQYTVGLRPVEEIRPLNMASVHHNDGGDIKNIIDCMFIAQYVVGIRDCHFELVP